MNPKEAIAAVLTAAERAHGRRLNFPAEGELWNAVEVWKVAGSPTPWIPDEPHTPPSETEALQARLAEAEGLRRTVEKVLSGGYAGDVITILRAALKWGEGKP